MQPQFCVYILLFSLGTHIRNIPMYRISYLWPSSADALSVFPLRSQMTFIWYLWALTCLSDRLKKRIHMLSSDGVCSRGKWIIYKNLSWHLLSNVERWRQNSCYCCRKQSAGDWIKVSRKWLLDGLLFSLIQLDVSLSCQLGITAVWFINRQHDLVI